MSNFTGPTDKRWQFTDCILKNKGYKQIYLFHFTFSFYQADKSCGFHRYHNPLT